jgi:hypothetical protein
VLFLAEQHKRVDGKCTLGGNPGGDDPEECHGEDNAGQDEGIAGIGLIDEESKYAAGQNSKE